MVAVAPGRTGLGSLARLGAEPGGFCRDTAEAAYRMKLGDDIPGLSMGKATADPGRLFTDVTLTLEYGGDKRREIAELFAASRVRYKRA
ncbi:hypothetical protein [Kitasatospora sp. NBC_00070]|uniref:hypothetical protein n=1 Tax=Kitasatospora sp. NBC_00070 TaxID=2975962 RepID=UPI0038603232